MSRMAKFKQPSQEIINLSRKGMRFSKTVRFLKNEHVTDTLKPLKKKMTCSGIYIDDVDLV